MICLRCGYCCINYSVIIVDDPEKGIIENNVIHHNGKAPCKHLGGNRPGEYYCKIHHYAWFKDTPCGQFTQIENSSNRSCRMGKFILKTKKNIGKEK